MSDQAPRREARERALSLLYEADAKGLDPETVLAEQPVPPDEFAIDLVVGVARNQAEADGLIRQYSKGWSLERMPVIDRTLLRMAIFELAHRADVPTAAIISEAVELAKRYSTDDSGKFVNGMLAAIAGQVRSSAE